VSKTAKDFWEAFSGSLQKEVETYRTPVDLNRGVTKEQPLQRTCDVIRIDIRERTYASFLAAFSPLKNTIELSYTTKEPHRLDAVSPHEKITSQLNRTDNRTYASIEDTNFLEPTCLAKYVMKLLRQ